MHQATAGYSSEFEDSKEERKRKNRHNDLDHKTKHPYQGHSSKIPRKSSFVDAYEKEEKKSHFAHFLSMSAYARHQKLVHDYLRYYGGSIKDFARDTSKDKTDLDILKENHKFVWDEDEESETWGKKLAKKYYDKLFKEYCICDLSRYKENKVAMRWRIEDEVVKGKGQFICGARKCQCQDGLRSWEVNFAYVENNERKNALVKTRLCPDCSYKLNYNHKHKKVKRNKKKSRKSKKRKHSRHSSTEGSSDSGGDGHSVDDASQVSSASPGTDNVWSQPVKEQVEKSTEEKFDEYLNDLFM